MKRGASRTFWSVVVPTLASMVGAWLLWPGLFGFLENTLLITMTEVAQESSFDTFVANMLTTFGLLFSILGGSSYSSLYSQNENIFYSIFAEVSEAKALVEQATLVCQGRPICDRVLYYIEQYVREDLRRLGEKPAVMLALRPRDDPLESILYITSVGVPSSVYDTVRSLRQIRGQRLGAVQRKMPFIQIILLWVLGLSLVAGSPLLILGVPGAARAVAFRSWFAVLCAAIVMTMRVIHELWTPLGGAYNVDGVLKVACRGLEEELRQRRQGMAFSSTDLPSPPPAWPQGAA